MINSGDGLKTLDAVSPHVGPNVTIPPRYEAFTEFLERSWFISATVRIPTILRTYTHGAGEVSVRRRQAERDPRLPGKRHPGIRARILDDAGALRRFVNVYVGDDDVRFIGGLDTEVVDGAKISIIPAVAGG